MQVKAGDCVRLGSWIPERDPLESDFTTNFFQMDWVSRFGNRAFQIKVFCDPLGRGQTIINFNTTVCQRLDRRVKTVSIKIKSDKTAEGKPAPDYLIAAIPDEQNRSYAGDCADQKHAEKFIPQPLQSDM